MRFYSIIKFTLSLCSLLIPWGFYKVLIFNKAPSQNYFWTKATHILFYNKWIIALFFILFSLQVIIKFYKKVGKSKFDYNFYMFLISWIMLNQSQLLTVMILITHFTFLTLFFFNVFIKNTPSSGST